MIVGRHSLKSSGVSLPGNNMREVSFHIYRGDEVIAHNLSIDELEEFLVAHHGNISKFEMIACENPEYDEASY